MIFQFFKKLKKAIYFYRSTPIIKEEKSETPAAEESLISSEAAKEEISQEERVITLGSSALLRALFEGDIPVGPAWVRLADGREIHGHFNDGKLTLQQTPPMTPLASGENQVDQLLEEAFEVNADAVETEDQLIIAFPSPLPPPASETAIAEDTDNKAEEGKMALGLLLSGKINGGILEGMGKVIFPCGKLIHGEFVEGFMRGYGVVILPDGTVRQGEFKDNLLHGAGRITLPSGHTIQGIFNQGKLVIETA